jgi:hypothetical protein
MTMSNLRAFAMKTAIHQRPVPCQRTFDRPLTMAFPTQPNCVVMGFPAGCSVGAKLDWFTQG